MPNKFVVNRRTSPYDVYCGRGSIWGNPWTHLPVAGTKAQYQVGTREESIAKHREYFLKDKALVARARAELKGKILGCYCAPLPCHCDVIAQVANAIDSRGHKMKIPVKGVHPQEEPRLSKQCSEILSILRHGPMTNISMAEVALSYTRRVSDLRAAGYDVQIVNRDRVKGVVWYELIPSKGLEP